jgi:hypothetical protein
VQTPLSITVWQRFATEGFQKAGEDLGVLTAHKGMPCNAFQPFYGRSAMSVTCLQVLGDRAPATTGEQAVKGLVGHTPDGMEFFPTRCYYLNILRRHPPTFVRMPAVLRDLARRRS